MTPAALRLDGVGAWALLAIVIWVLWVAGDGVLEAAGLGQKEYLPPAKGLVRSGATFLVPAAAYLGAVQLVPGVESGAPWPAAVFGVVALVMLLARRWVHEVTSVRFHGVREVGGLLAVAGQDRTVRLWDPGTRKHVGTLRGHLGPVLAVCTVNGLVASAGADKTIRLWDPGTGEQVRVLKGHRKWVCALCVVRVAGSDLLFSGDYSGVLRRWDLWTGMGVRVRQRHRGVVWTLCQITVDGRVLLASAGFDRTIRLWDPGTGEQVGVLGGYTGAVRALCEVRDGERVLLASAGQDGMVRLWDLRSGRHVRSLEGALRPYDLATVRMDGKVLVAAVGDGRGVFLWDPFTGEHLRTLGADTLNAFSSWPWAGLRGICAVRVGGETMFATTGYDIYADDYVQLHDPAG